MRRILSFQVWRALFGSVPRILLVCGVLVVYVLVAMWLEPFVPWWVGIVAGLCVIAGLIYLGSVWLDRDIMRYAEDDTSSTE